jgi:hypothetical protein
VSTRLEPGEGTPNAQVPNEYLVQTPRETADYFAAALNVPFTSEFAANGQPVSISPAPTKPRANSSPHASSNVTSPSTRGYLGRSAYLGQELQDHEDSAVQDRTDLPHTSLTAEDWKVLDLRRAFDLPPRAVCESLTATFIEKCHPWIPVVDDETLYQLQNGDMSKTPLLLLQAIFMAGS